MYLFNKNGNKLDLYNLLPKDKKLYEYRVEKMKQIPDEKKFLYGITSMGIENYEIFKLYENKFDIEIIPIQNANGMYHRLEETPINSNKDKLLNAYYNGQLKDKKIARISDLKKIRYLLLNQTQYKYYPGIKVLEEIIEIPESLYLLSLIEQEKFSLIGDKDISEQISLFKLEQLKGFDLDTIERMDYVGIFPGGYLKTIQKAENDEKILKLIK